MLSEQMQRGKSDCFLKSYPNGKIWTRTRLNLVLASC